MSIAIQEPVASIVLGINSKFFTSPNLNTDHLVFLVKDLLSTDFPDYKVNCFIDTIQDEKYSFDIHNAQIYYENVSLNQNSKKFGSLYFPDLEENLKECLDDFEIRFASSIYPEFLAKLNTIIPEDEVLEISNRSISYCVNQKQIQSKVDLFNQLLLNSEFDFSGFSFYVNYSDTLEIYFVDYKSNTIGHFCSEINTSLVKVWIKTIGELRIKAKKLGYEYVTSNNGEKNQFETFIVPVVSSDTFLDNELYTSLLDEADNTISNADLYNEIKQIKYSVFMLFKESFSDGMAEKCYDLTYDGVSAEW